MPYMYGTPTHQHLCRSKAPLPQCPHPACPDLLYPCGTGPHGCMLFLSHAGALRTACSCFALGLRALLAAMALG